MNIELKDTGKVFSDGAKIFNLYIDNRVIDQLDYMWHKDRYAADGYSEDVVIAEFYDLPCAQLPEKLEIHSYIRNAMNSMDYGMVDVICFYRKQDILMVKMEIWFEGAYHKDAYLSPYKLLEHAVKIAPDYGFIDCEAYCDVTEPPYASFSHGFKAEGIILSKIEECKKLLNQVMREAAKEMYHIIGKQLAAGKR